MLKMTNVINVQVQARSWQLCVIFSKERFVWGQYISESVTFQWQSSKIANFVLFNYHLTSIAAASLYLQLTRKPS